MDAGNLSSLLSSLPPMPPANLQPVPQRTNNAQSASENAEDIGLPGGEETTKNPEPVQNQNQTLPQDTSNSFLEFSALEPDVSHVTENEGKGDFLADEEEDAEEPVEKRTKTD